jgi:hypothetical protein
MGRISKIMSESGHGVSLIKFPDICPPSEEPLIALLFNLTICRKE